MPDHDRDKWDEHYRDLAVDTPAPCLALQEYSHLLPRQGKALDLASGRGGNALSLAQHGLQTSAWDISPIALEQLRSHAAAHDLVIHTQARDVVLRPPESASFDVIVVSRFLHRPLCPRIANALLPGGLLFYQTFLREKTDTALGPSNPDYLLHSNELLSLFPGLTLAAYREEGLIGNTNLGFRNEAMLVAMKQ